MKTSLLLLLSLLCVNAVIAQSFEGKIAYQLSYKSKLPSMTDEQWRSIGGSQHEYYFKDGNYKTVVSAGAMMQWQLFIKKDNRLYTKFANSETILWNDAAINQDSVLSSQLNKGVTQVNGYTCDELVLTCKSGIQKYYYSSKINVDPSLFVNHKYGNWYDYLSKAGALPLKYTFDMPQFVMEATASQVVAMAIEDSVFLLPADAKTAKSSF